MNKQNVILPHNVLVTGAGGYIGSIATYLLLQKGIKVCAVDNFVTGHKGPFLFFEEKFGKDAFHWYERDLHEDLHDVFEKEKPEAVLHYAASCSVDESMKDPGKYFYNNVCGTNNLLDTMVKHDVKKLVFSSTCAVYGESQYMPMDENHPTNPLNPYGLSKRMVEQMIEWFGNSYDLQYVILRYFNVCGASDDGEVGDAKNPSLLLMQNAVRGALEIEPFYLTCGTVDTPDGTPIRDYINVVDLNMAHLAALSYMKEGGESEIINLGTGTGNSVLEIINEVQNITGKTFELQKKEPRQGEYAKVYADITKAKNRLHWEPTHSVKDSVEALVKWYTKHPKGW
jgi:UDP-glucose 4-epimerase